MPARATDRQRRGSASWRMEVEPARGGGKVLVAVIAKRRRAADGTEQILNVSSLCCYYYYSSITSNQCHNSVFELALKMKFSLFSFLLCMQSLFWRYESENIMVIGELTMRRLEYNQEIEGQ